MTTINEIIEGYIHDFLSDWKSDYKISEDLTSLSSKIKKTDKTEEKIDLLVKLDNLMKNNKELIKKKFHDNIVSILNSL